MEKKISLDLANHYYYIKLVCAEPQALFNSVFAYQFFITTLNPHDKLSVLGYCLLPNSVHLLVKSDTQPSTWLEPLLMRYNQWQQDVTGKTGYVFDDDQQAQLLIQPKFLPKALRYLHRLPIQHKLCASPEQYLYTSYHDYTGNSKTGSYTHTVLAMLSPHNSQRVRKFIDYTMDASPLTFDMEMGNHIFYQALADDHFIAKALSQYTAIATEEDEQHQDKWDQCIHTLKVITGQSEETLLGVSRHHGLPDAHYLLAWLFLKIAKGPNYFAAKQLKVDNTTLQLNVKSISLHHPQAYLRYIANFWQAS